MVAFVLLALGHGRAASVATHSTAAQVITAEPTLLPVALPDLSGMHASVREQLREAYASLMTLQPETGVEPPV